MVRSTGGPQLVSLTGLLERMYHKFIEILQPEDPREVHIYCKTNPEPQKEQRYVL
jgi:hypothetical protein